MERETKRKTKRKKRQFSFTSLPLSEKTNERKRLPKKISSSRSAFPLSLVLLNPTPHGSRRRGSIVPAVAEAVEAANSRRSFSCFPRSLPLRRDGFAAAFRFFLGGGGASAAAATPCNKPSLFSRLKLDPDLSDFAALLESVGYRNSLEDEQGVTLLAPSNEALRAVPPPQLRGGGGNGGSGGNGGGKGFNSSLALLKSVPAAARAAVGGHILRGAVRNPQSELAQGRWLRTLATAKKPGTQDRSLGVTVVGGGGTSVVLLRSDAGATARATFVPADSGGCGGGDALMKLDGVLWPF